MRFGEIKENARVGASFLWVDGTSFGKSWVRQSCDKSLKLTEPESDEETPSLGPRLFSVSFRSIMIFFYRRHRSGCVL